VNQEFWTSVRAAYDQKVEAGEMTREQADAEYGQRRPEDDDRRARVDAALPKRGQGRSRARAVAAAWRAEQARTRGEQGKTPGVVDLSGYDAESVSRPFARPDGERRG